MKAPDIVESWKWKDPSEIIERLISESSRAAGKTIEAPQKPAPAPTDRHCLRLKRLKIRLALKRAKRGGR